MGNSYDAIVADLSQKLAAAQAQLQIDQQSLDGWRNSYQTHAGQGDWESAAIDTAKINERTQDVTRGQALVDTLTKQLDDATKIRDQIAAAAAEAIANGKDPDTAIREAEAKVVKSQGQKAFWILGGIGAFVLLIVIAVVVLKRRAKK